MIIPGSNFVKILFSYRSYNVKYCINKIRSCQCLLLLNKNIYDNQFDMFPNFCERNVLNPTLEWILESNICYNEMRNTFFKNIKLCFCSFFEVSVQTGRNTLVRRNPYIDDPDNWMSQVFNKHFEWWRCVSLCVSVFVIYLWKYKKYVIYKTFKCVCIWNNLVRALHHV